MSTLPSTRIILTDLIHQLSSLEPGRPPTADPNAPAPNPLKALEKEAREIIVALEYLIPGGVTAALDVLDKGLVTRYCVGIEVPEEEVVEEENAAGEGTMQPTEREIPGTPNGSGSEISDIDSSMPLDPTSASAPVPAHKHYAYHVHPEPLPRPRWSKTPPRPAAPPFAPVAYSVRPTAWFCSCPSFVLSALSEPSGALVTSWGRRRRWEAQEAERVAAVREKIGWVWGGRSLGVGHPPVCKHLVACVLVERCPGLFGGFVKEVEVEGEEMVALCVGMGRL